MANPTAPTESGGLAVDFVADTAGAARFKLAVGSNTITGASNVGGYQGVATHQQRSGSFADGQPVVTAAGVDSANVVRANVSDTDGVVAVRPRGLTGTVTTSVVSLSSNVASSLPASAATGRGTVTVQADTGNSLSVFVGASGVTYLTGIELTAGQTFSADLGSATLYAISGGAMKVRVIEVA